MAKKNSAATWAACKAAMTSWPRNGVLALLHELYELSDDNRRFLHARLVPASSAETLEDAKKKLRGMLSKQSVFNGHFSHAEIKRFIDRYEKGCDDPRIIAELLVADLEFGYATFAKVGDFEPMVDHLYATLARLEKCFEKLDAPTMHPLVVRLSDLAKRWGEEFGYGISDELVDFSEQWQERATATNADDRDQPSPRNQSDW